MHSSTIPRSHVIHLGNDSSRCGYCTSNDGSYNYAMWALRLDVADYQELLDAGWRRSGNYLYRPDLKKTCCPPYVIRLQVNQFEPSSTHKRVLKRLRHASSPADPRNHRAQKEQRSRRKNVVPPDQNQNQVRRMLVEAIHSLTRNHSLQPPLRAEDVQEVIPKVKVFPPRPQSHKAKSRHRQLQSSPTSNTSIIRAAKPGDVNEAAPALVSNAAFAIAGIERRRNTSRNSSSSDSGTNTKSGRDNNPLERQMTIANALHDILHQNHHMCTEANVYVTYPGFLNFWWLSPDKAPDENERIRDEKESHHQRLTQQVSSVARSSGQQKIFPQNWKRPWPSRLRSLEISDVSEMDVMSELDRRDTLQGQSHHQGLPQTHVEGSLHESLQHRRKRWGEVSDGELFSMQIVPAAYREESFQLFRRYQMKIHGERSSQCTKDVYSRFLVDSPLVRYHSPANPEEQYGSYHILYRLADRLFAVGVVDILPRCLSSVYLFYDPDFAKLSPGTLSALKEIEWIKSMTYVYSSMGFYYMGYYIHSCPKMRYKAAFYPSELQCELTKNWVPVPDAQQILDREGERALRLCPLDREPAPAAANFQFDDEELQRMTDEAILHMGSADDEVMRLMPFGDVKKLLRQRCPEQVEAIRKSIEAFLHHVGKVSAKYFIHML